jgi:hypothetical protein
VLELGSHCGYVVKMEVLIGGCTIGACKTFFSSLLDSIIAVKLFFFFPFWTTFVL